MASKKNDALLDEAEKIKKELGELKKKRKNSDLPSKKKTITKETK